MWPFFESEDRIVAQTTVAEGVMVSTVFLGIDHSWDFSIRKPLLFESMIFGGPMDGDQERYATWIGAEAGHKKLVEKVKQTLLENKE